MSPSPSPRSTVIHFDRRFLLFLFKAGLLLLLLLGFLWVLSYSRMVLTPLILAVLLSILLNPLVVALERRGLRRTLGVILVLVAMLVLLAAALAFLAPVISHEFKTIGSFIKEETPASLMDKLRNLLERHIPWLGSSGYTAKIVTWAEGFLHSLLGRSIQLLPSVIPVVIAVVLIPFMTFFLLKDGRRLKKSFIRALPNRYFEMAVSLLDKIDHQLGSFIRGQILVSLCIGALAITALAILRVPYFLLIGAIAGLANMIPYFGPIVGAVPAIILNVIARGSLKAALPVVAAFLLIRLIDDTLVSPNILGHSMKLHPLLVIIVIFIGGEMFGIMGLLLCIPVTGILKVIIQEVAWNMRHYRILRGGE
ncbi:MAG: AI-2E family transporter [Candidatus Aminicenantes bacterium]|nr:AI-2E family transporter [Candidatus Aminicenantes bacterium]